MTDFLDALITLAQETRPFATILRGPLTSGPSIAMEAAESDVSRHMDRNEAVRTAVVINAKHTDMTTAYEAVLAIQRRFTHLEEYPSGAGWQIVDVWAEDFPRLIGREKNNTWLFATSLTASIYYKE